MYGLFSFLNCCYLQRLVTSSWASPRATSELSTYRTSLGKGCGKQGGGDRGGDKLGKIPESTALTVYSFSLALSFFLFLSLFTGFNLSQLEQMTLGLDMQLCIGHDNILYIIYYILYIIYYI